MSVFVVGVDGTDSGRTALERAVHWARALDARVHVVYVSHLNPVLMAASQSAPIPVHDYADAERAFVWTGVDEVLDREDGVEVERVDLDGYPPDALVAYADSVDADLLVVGSRGRGDIASLVLGSTSHRVTHTATCDVLVVKGEES